VAAAIAAERTGDRGQGNARPPAEDGGRAGADQEPAQERRTSESSA
jgi:hypothetical protein